MTAAAPTYTGFETLEELQAANLALMRAWRPGAANGMIDTREIDGFMRRAIATGKRLSASQDRELAQSTLDFWATELLRLGRVEPRQASELQLARFDVAALPALGETSPFKDLKFHDEIDAAIFPSRENVARKLADQVEKNAVTIVVGPSGSGKASLIGAGLLPALRERHIIGEEGRLELARIPVPGPDPLHALAALLLGEAADKTALRTLRDKLEAQPETFGAELSTAFPRPILLVVGQFEEILTLGVSPEARDAFARAMASLGKDARLVLCLRDDFLDEVKRLPRLGEIAADADNRFLPPPIAPADLKRAVIAIADRAGVRFAEGVLDRLVRAIAGEAAGLPLLQFTLDELWREARRTRTNWISEEVEQRVGAPRQALQRAAERVYQALPLPDKEEVVRDLFLQLITAGLDHDVLRKPRRRAELRAGHNADSVDRVLADFTDAGLLRREQEAGTSDDWYDVAHEALIRTWPRLHAWLEGQRETHRKLLQLRELARLWADNGRAIGYLLSGDALAEARAFQGQSEILDELIGASGRNERRTRTALAIGKSVLAVTVAAFAGFIYWADKRNDELREQQARDEVTAARTETQAIKDNLRAALERFNVADRAPLEQFLRRYGDAQDSELRLLGLIRGEASAASDARSQIVATRQRSVRPASQSTPCRGYMWLGYPDQWKVAPAPAGTTVAIGTMLTLNTSVRLRAGAPGDNYSMARQIGIVPKDAIAKVVGATVAIERSRGLQYWSEVETARQYCTNVFIQYTGSPSADIGPVSNTLDEAGFQVPPSQRIDAARGRAEVRYFYAEDAPMAAEIARLLARYNRGQPLAQTPLLAFAAKPASGTLEVWIDLDP